MRLALLLVVCIALVSACELKTGDIKGLKGQEKCDHIDSCAGKSKKQFHCQWWEKSDKRELNEHIEFLTKKSNKDEQYYEMAKRLLKNGATGAVYNLLHAYPGKQLELGLASTQSTDSQPVVQKAGETLGDFQKRQADQRESAKKTVLDQFLALKGHEQPVDPEHCSCVKFPDNGLPYAWDDKAGFQRFCDFWKWSFRAAGVCVDGKVVAFDESTKKLNTFNCPTKPLTVSKWVVTGSAVSGTQYVRKYKKEDGTLIRAAFDGVDAVGDRKREPSDVDTAVESPSLFTYFTSNGVADDSGRTKTMDSREPVWTGLRVKGAPWTFGEQRWALQQVVGKPNHGYETDEVREINMMAYREDTTRHGKAMEILCPDLDTKKDKEMLALVQEYDDKLRSFEKLSPAKRKQIIAKSKGFLASFLGFIEEDAVQSSLPDNTLSPL